MKGIFGEVPDHLTLSNKVTAQLEHLADTLAQDALESYAHYRDWGIDPRKWKQTSRRGSLTVYKEKAVARTQELRALNGDSQLVSSKHPTPTLLIAGTIKGTVEDAMYGLHADSDTAVRLRSSYAKDNFQNFHWLNKLRGPTHDDPFRLSGVAWTVLANSGFPFVSARDCCAIVSMGMKRTPDRKENIGYYIMHSVDDLLPALYGAKFVRARLSFCVLYRQRDDQYVEVFVRGFFAPMGSMPEMAVVSSASNLFLKMAAPVMDTSYNKKLFWLMNQSFHEDRNDHAENTRGCAGGCRSFTVGANKCIVCCMAVCNSCKAPRKITVDASSDRVIQKSFLFCVLCVDKAETTSAGLFIYKELVERGAIRNQRSGTGSSSKHSLRSKQSTGGSSVRSAAGIRRGSVALTYLSEGKPPDNTLPYIEADKDKSFAVM